MSKIYIDKIVTFKQFDVREDGDIFQTILDERQGKRDSQRFFLDYLPEEIANGYDFNDLESLQNFREACFRISSPLQGMGGCNLTEEYLQKGIRYAGIKISDPTGKVYGTFNVNEDKMIYSPIFPHFYEERDHIKFANDKYFTTMTFNEIMERQIELAKEFYIHTGNYMKFEDVMKYGNYIFEKVDKDRMFDFLNQPEIGEQVFKRSLGLK